MRLRVFPATLVLMTMAACADAGQTPSGAKTGIEGTITISPTQPGPVRDDSPASKPLANAIFAVENEKGEVAAITTDGQGHFRTLVPPGHYKVSMKGRKSSIGRFGPFEVDVVAGKMTNVQWQCDSGIR
jgi:acetylornithine deacetylase/succinyl-diaminopimelate desuccinylase-like protein